MASSTRLAQVYENMCRSSVRIIQAILLAAAVVGLLLTTPSLEARTKKQSTKKAHRHSKKKMKIVFDGSAPEDQKGELGDEVVQPHSTDRRIAEPGSVVHMRGSSVEDLWKKNKLVSRTHAKARAEQNATSVEENPDLIEPVSTAAIEEPASLRSSAKTVLAENLSVNESLLGSFKTTKPSALSHKKLAKQTTKQTTAALMPVGLPPAEMYPSQSRPVSDPEMIKVANAETVTPLPAPIMEFEDVKPVKRVQRKAVSRIYLRNVQPVVSSNSLATHAYLNAPSDFKFNFAFENTTTVGRKYELEAPGGRNYLMKNEIFVGTTHSSEWGAKISFDYVVTSNDDSNRDIHEMGDPSLIVEHPAIFKTRDVNVHGQIRYFVPAATTSKAKSLQQFAYYLIADMQLIGQLSLANIFVPRYYVQTTYADSDAFSLVTDTTEVSRKFDWFGAGVGQRTQVESHQATSPGSSVEVYPFLSFLGISNTIISAKLYIPLIGSGIVNGAPGSSSGPTTSGLSGAQAEFLARIAF